MQKTIMMGLLAGSVALAGCARHAQAPLPTNFPTQEQQQLQAASHWQVIAEDAARQLMAALPGQPPLHVVRTQNQSPFEEAFTTQLISILSAAGYPVMKTTERPGTLLVEVNANPVRFSEQRRRPAAVGELTLLAGGLWVLRNLYENASPGAAMMAAAVAADAGRWFGAGVGGSHSVPQTELIVTTSVSSTERYHAQVSNAYYTTQSDWGLYARNAVLPLKGGN